MNEQRTVRVKASLTKTMLWVTAILVIGTGSAVAQQSFRDFAKEYGYDWLAGQWTATTDEGQTIQLVYRWELDGHLVTAGLKMGEYASRSMIFYVPAEEKVIQVGVDNRGGRSKGTWEPQDDKLVFKSERVDADGEKQNIAVIYSKVDAKTMKVALHATDEDGELADEPWGTLEFKRKGGRTGRKTDRPAGRRKKKSE